MAGRRKRIVILDDDGRRVQRLLSAVGNRAQVDWQTTVRGAQDTLVRRSADLLILDHDLGPGSLTSADANGHDGLTAARRLYVLAGTPILVWSHNPLGAHAMAQALVNRGVHTVIVAPEGSPTAADFVKRVVG